MAVVQVGGRDRGQQQPTVRVGENVTLAAHHAAGRVKAALARDAHPTCAAWASTTAAVGLASRPARSRSTMARAWASRSNAPDRASARNQRCTVGQGGNSRGRCRHAASPEHVQDRVENSPHGPAAGPARRGGRGQKRGDRAPLGVGQVGCIGASIARKLRTGGRGPHGRPQERRILRRTPAIPAAHPTQAYPQPL